MSVDRRRPDDPAGYYEAHVFCCTNRRPAGHPRGCCAEKGAEELRDYFKAKARAVGLSNVRVNMAGCLDRCELGPTVVIYPEGIWYSVASKGDIDEIIDAHLQRGERIERLMLRPTDKLPADRKS
jgi:(2Fe-2S) ferredoxin